MTTTTATAPRHCYSIRYASVVHSGPVVELVYAASPVEALATFNADGPAVQVLSVDGPDFAEYAVTNGQLANRPTSNVFDDLRQRLQMQAESADVTTH
jgi:hypothetical protein